MKAIVDRDRCVGHARCYAKAPDIFDVDDEGFALGGEHVIAPADETRAAAAAAACPERAIAIAIEAQADTVPVTFILREGGQRVVDATPGRTLLETAQDAAIDGVAAECGGAASCATCHVYLDDAAWAALPAPELFEDEMLDGVMAERLPTSRLSCQVIVSREVAAMVVTIPDRQF